MRIVTAGAGALGCLLAGRLATVIRPGDQLILLDLDPEKVEQVNRHSMLVDHAGRESCITVPATADPARISGCDLFLLCCRLREVDAVLEGSNHLFTPRTLLIAFQCAISHLDRIMQLPSTPSAATASCDVFEAVPGRICCLDTGSIHIGLLQKGQQADLLERTVDLFNMAGLPTESSEDIMQQLLERFFVDLGVNALAALYKRPNGQLLTSCSLRANLKKAILEAVAVSEAAGLAPAGDPVKRTFEYLRTDKQRIAPMFRDISNRLPTEIDFLNGAITEIGKKFRIPTPVNDDLVTRIKKLEAGYL